MQFAIPVAGCRCVCVARSRALLQWYSRNGDVTCDESFAWVHRVAFLLVRVQSTLRAHVVHSCPRCTRFVTHVMCGARLARREQSGVAIGVLGYVNNARRPASTRASDGIIDTPCTVSRWCGAGSAY